jgi:hypothetical protein
MVLEMSVSEIPAGINRFNNPAFAAVMESGERFGLFLRDHHLPGCLVEVRVSETPSVFAIMNASGPAGVLNETEHTVYNFGMGSPLELENFQKHYGKMALARAFMIIPVEHTMNNNKGDESKVIAFIKAHNAHIVFDRIFSDAESNPEAKVAFRGTERNNWSEIVDRVYRDKFDPHQLIPFDWPAFRHATPATPAPLQVRANEFFATIRAQKIKPQPVLP